jgi:hypothetical protein
MAAITPMTTPTTEAGLRRCLRDRTWRLNNLYTVVDEGGNKVPFRQRAVQRDACQTTHGCDVYLKSRQHGITTEKCIETLDDAMMLPDLQCGIIAHTKGDAAEIFATKIETPYLCLPEAIRQANPAVELDRSHIKFSNGSTIRVAVSFRSATTHRLHISEYGKICAKYPARAEEIKTGTLPSVHPQMGGRISIESTAEGAAGHFYDLCKMAEAETIRSQQSGRPLGVKQYRFHFYPWYADPKNAVDPLGLDSYDDLTEYFDELQAKHGIVLTPEQRAWYTFTKFGPGGLGSEMTREHPSTPEEAFEASVTGAVFGEEMAAARADGRIGRVPWVKDQPVYTGWDLGVGDATAVWFFQLIRDEVHFIDYYAQVGRGAAYHAKQVLSKPYIYDHESKWCLMPHDVMHRSKDTATVLKDTYEALGLKCKVVERVSQKADAIGAVRDAFNRFHFDARNCDHDKTELSGLKALAYYRYAWDDEARTYSKLPIHDWASHGASALETVALGIRYGKVGKTYVGDMRPVAAYHDQDDDEVVNW